MLPLTTPPPPPPPPTHAHKTTQTCAGNNQPTNQPNTQPAKQTTKQPNTQNTPHKLVWKQMNTHTHTHTPRCWASSSTTPWPRSPRPSSWATAPTSWPSPRASTRRGCWPWCVHADGWVDAMGGWMEGMDGWVSGCDGWMDAMNGWVGGWMGAWVGGWRIWMGGGWMNIYTRLLCYPSLPTQFNTQNPKQLHLDLSRSFPLAPLLPLPNQQQPQQHQRINQSVTNQQNYQRVNQSIILVVGGWITTESTALNSMPVTTGFLRSIDQSIRSSPACT